MIAIPTNSYKKLAFSLFRQFIFWNLIFVDLLCFVITTSKLTRAQNKLQTLEKRCEACSKLTIKTVDQVQWRCFGIFIINFEHISHLFAVFLLLTVNMYIFSGIIFTSYQSFEKTHYHYVNLYFICNLYKINKAC